MEWRLKAGEGKEETGSGRPVVGRECKMERNRRRGREGEERREGEAVRAVSGTAALH